MIWWDYSKTSPDSLSLKKAKECMFANVFNSDRSLSLKKSAKSQKRRLKDKGARFVSSF